VIFYTSEPKPAVEGWSTVSEVAVAGGQQGADVQRDSRGAVQSVSRAFEVLETLAEHGPLTLSRLATESGLPLSTVHRLVGSLVSLGYVRLGADKRYVLAPRLIHLGERSARMLARWAVPHLAELVDELGETANLATLDDDHVVYVAQVPSRHSMRMFTEVGRHVLPHCTAVGKALLAELPRVEVASRVRRTGLPARTDRTLTTQDDLETALDRVRSRGYAVDDGEQEVGVRCVAVVVPDSVLPLAMSVSGPATRLTDDVVARAVPALRTATQRLAEDLSGGPEPKVRL
jgi:IclR family transcriptional regulator, acetate operon repressor